MKKLLKLFRRVTGAIDIVFLMRIQSIRKHIQLAVDSVDYEMLKQADRRIEIELAYSHTDKEIDIIYELLGAIHHARELMNETLIKESLQCSHN